MTVAIIGELTADASTIILMAAGPDHEVAAAARVLETLTPLCTPTKPAGALQVPATWPAVVQLSAAFGPYWRPQPALVAWMTEQVLARSAAYDCRALTVAPPPGCVPRSYQVAGALMIGAVGSALIFDDPGTGKTITTILGLVERAAELGRGVTGPGALISGQRVQPVTPVLVVAPNGVVDPWIDEFRRWAPQWRVKAWRGSPAQRRAMAGTADVYVTSYGTARRDARDTSPRNSPLIALRPASVVADEVHQIKHPDTEQSKALRRLGGRAGMFIGLSGTPITHSPDNLWPALDVLEPGAWPSKERWSNRYVLTLPGDYRNTPLGLHPQAEAEFRTTLLGRHRRVAKADVLPELPPKVHSVRVVELPAQYRAAYDAMERDMLDELPDDGGELSVMTILAQFTRLSQLASAAADVETISEVVWDEQLGVEVEKTHQHVTLKAPSWKVDALLEVLDERPGEQVVVFGPSRQLINLAGEAAAKTGRRVGYIIGGQSAKVRTANREAFQRGEQDIICVTTSAGGVGLTLTAARTAVFLQRPWSLVEAMQAEDRIHRIGAERHQQIDVIDIVARNTIDTRVRAVLRERAGQLADLVQDPRIVAELLGGADTRDLRKKAAA